MLNIKWPFYFILLSLILGISFQVPGQLKRYVIIGHANGFNGKQLILSIPDSLGVYQNDTCKISNNQFTFSGQIPHSVLCSISTPDEKTSNIFETRPFFIDPGEQIVEITNGHFESPTISGSITDSLFVYYLQLENELKIKLKNQRELLKEKHLVQTMNDSLHDELENALMRLAIDVLKKNRSSVLSAYLLRYYMSDLEDSTLLALYDSLDPNIKSSFYGKFVYKRLQVSTGMKAPEFAGITFDSLQFSLTEQLKSSKLLMLVFWASWCKPCREEVPYLKMLKKEFVASGLEIVAIANDDKRVDRWSKAISEDDSYQFIHLLQNNGHPEDIGALYSVMPIPTIILINSKGVIVYRKTGGPYADLLQIIPTILKNN